MIQVIVLDETHLDKMGIYRLSIGDNYYIGATKNIFERMLRHQYSINNWFIDCKIGKNSVTKMCLYLTSNKWITNIFMELIDEIGFEECLVDCEQKWFDACFDDPKCLNFKFMSYRKVNGIEIRGHIFAS